MNTFSKNTKALFALLLSCMLVVACEDDTPVEEQPIATITAIDPSTGPVGTTVEIAGTNFGDAGDVESVDFNGTAATVTSVTDELIVVTVPAGATTGPVNLVVRGEEIAGPDFTVTEEVEGMSITSIDPTTGPVGTEVIITGEGFGEVQSDQVVKFGGVEAEITELTNEEITAVVPAGAVTGAVTFTMDGKTIEGPEFTVTEDQTETTITAIDPTEGYIGDEVIITGTGFGQGLTDQAVFFGEVKADISALTKEEIIVLVPAGAVTGPVSVVLGDTMTVEGPEFTVLEKEAEPGVTNMSPSAGPVGTEVSIFGAGFGTDPAAVTVSFNGMDAEVVSVKENEIVATVPETATTGPVSVMVGDATYEGGNFTVTTEEGGIYFGEGFPVGGPVETFGQSFIYEGGGINGETVLRLTPAKSDRTSAAYYGAKVNVEGGFETTFNFRISRPGKPEGVEGETGADGLSFIITGAELTEDAALGSRGPEMGYGGIKDALVIEFDTYQNTEDEDPNGNHLSVQASVGGPGTPVHADPNYRLAQTTIETHPDLPQFIGNESSSHTARVVYTPGGEFEKGLLQVWVDGMETPLQVAIDLSDYMALENGKAFVGFTASTNHEYGWEAHDILNWTFTPLGL